MRSRFHRKADSHKCVSDPHQVHQKASGNLSVIFGRARSSRIHLDLDLPAREHRTFLISLIFASIYFWIPYLGIENRGSKCSISFFLSTPHSKGLTFLNFRNRTTHTHLGFKSASFICFEGNRQIYLFPFSHYGFCQNISLSSSLPPRKVTQNFIQRFCFLQACSLN